MLMKKGELGVVVHAESTTSPVSGGHRRTEQDAVIKQTERSNRELGSHTYLHNILFKL